MENASMRSQRIDYDTEIAVGKRARIGLIVLRTDQTVEHEARILLPQFPGVALFHSRIFNDFTITRESLLEMAPHIQEASGLLPPEWDFKSIGFGCTSGAMVIGDRRIQDEICAVHPDAKVTNPLTAATSALQALGGKSIGLVTPYSERINRDMVEKLEMRGFSVAALASFEEPDDNVVATISTASITRAVESVASVAEVEAVLIACTSLRAVHAIEQIERAIGKPVTSSNHALLWHLLRLAGIDDSVSGFGKLFSMGLKVVTEDEGKEFSIVK